MALALPLYEMALGIELTGTVMSLEEIRPSEIQQWLKEAFGVSAPYPDPRQPPMLPNAKAVVVVSAYSCVIPCLSSSLSLVFDLPPSFGLLGPDLLLPFRCPAARGRSPS